MAKGGYGKKGDGILAFVLCLPLAFIIYFLVSYSSHTITLDNVKKITVTVPDSQAIVLESQEDIDFFVEVLTGGTSVSSAVRDVKDETPVTIVCDRKDKAIEFKLYPSLNLSGCMIVDSEGDIYVLNTESARKLLLRSEFDYLYSDYFLPQLSVVSGNNVYNVAPSKCSWSYIKSDDNVYEYVPQNLSAGNEIYPILKGLENNLRFGNGDKAPDVFDISFVSENGTKYESISDISELNLSVDTKITIDITASWSNRNGAKYFGDAEYSFTVLYDVPAKIDIEKTEYKLGDVIEVYASHLNENETISLETLLVYNDFQFGVFTRDLGVALIPVGIDNNVGKTSLLIGTDAGKNQTDVEILALTTGELIPVYIGNAQYEAKYTPAAQKDFESAISAITRAEARPSRNDYFKYDQSRFQKPINNGELKYSFGQQIHLAFDGDYTDSGMRTLNGVVYSANEGDNVRAMEAGEIVFMGELDVTGKTVVIYHGYGIYSYYYHLSEFDANLQVGSEVNAGYTVGEVGTVQLSDDKSSSVLHFATSINGVFVNPEWFFAK